MTMKLEDLVPPLELCNQLKPGEFEDSAMVWVDGIRDIDHKFVTVRTHSSEDYEEAPAPTLAEILDALAQKCDDVTVWMGATAGWHVQVLDMDIPDERNKHDLNPATAAMRLYLEVSND